MAARRPPLIATYDARPRLLLFSCRALASLRVLQSPILAAQGPADARAFATQLTKMHMECRARYRISCASASSTSAVSQTLISF